MDTKTPKMNRILGSCRGERDETEPVCGYYGDGTTTSSCNEKRQDLRKSLREEIGHYRAQGLSVALNGKNRSTEQIVRACLREQGAYMRDYVIDEQKHVRKVDFIRIRK